MKTFVLTLALAAATTLSYAQQGSKTAKTTTTKKTTTTAPAAAPAKGGPAFTWKETTYDFGQIEQGTPKTAVFNFTNSGGAPLVVSEARGSCGCTIADYTKEPVAPGKMGTVKATYNAAAAGVFSKTVTVTSNTGEPVTLIIKGEVMPKKEDAGK